ncbi:MAG: GNAT family N-acetyltransferase [Alphaproteobacteria bacterium]|nr:GNAT family N-acetyltransferase [Alphaproteobacteria bacterium]
MAELAIEAVDGRAAALLAELHRQCFDMGWSEEELAALLATPGASALLATRGAEPLGFLITRQAADEAEIITIGTRPEMRREGIARHLIEAASQRLAAISVARFFAEVAAGNHAARALYARLGFSEVGMRHGYYAGKDGPAEDAHVLLKVLRR